MNKLLKRCTLVALLVAATFILSKEDAHASLIGDTVHIAQYGLTQWEGEEQGADVIVVDVPEWTFDFLGPRYNVDVSDSRIRINFLAQIGLAGGDWAGPIVSQMDDSSGDPINGFTNFQTNHVGITESRISFGSDITHGNWLGFNGQGIGFNAGDFVSVDLNFAVPEPELITLLGIGVLGLIIVGATRHKWKKKMIKQV